MDVPHPEAPQDGEHEDADPSAEIPAVDGHQELESPGEEEHPAGWLAVGGGPLVASGEPGGKTGLEREQHRRAQDEPGDEPAEPGRGQCEQKRGPDDRPADTRRQEPAGPAGQVRLAIPLGTPRPGGGDRAGPEAEGAGGVGGDESGRAISEDRRHNREGEDRAPPRHGVDGCGDEGGGGEEQQLLGRESIRRPSDRGDIGGQRKGHHFAPRPRSPRTAAGSRLPAAGNAAGRPPMPFAAAASTGALIPPSTSM